MWNLGLAVLCLAYVADASPKKAVAVLNNPATGIQGTINFVETAEGVLISGNITGLKAGKHGFHIHEKGDISDPKCVSAGPHFNPFNKIHGGPNDQDRHIGDLGNVEAVDNETTIFSFIDKLISLKDDTNIIGRSIVIHASEDDFGRGDHEDSKTTGHAGDRLACAIIKSGASQLQSTSVLLVLIGLLVIARHL